MCSSADPIERQHKLLRCTDQSTTYELGTLADDLDKSGIMDELHSVTQKDTAEIYRERQSGVRGLLHRPTWEINDAEYGTLGTLPDLS